MFDISKFQLDFSFGFHFNTLNKNCLFHIWHYSLESGTPSHNIIQQWISIHIVFFFSSMRTILCHISCVTIFFFFVLLPCLMYLVSSRVHSPKWRRRRQRHCTDCRWLIDKSNETFCWSQFIKLIFAFIAPTSRWHKTQFWTKQKKKWI